MIAVVQRVRSASVRVRGETVAGIGRGLLVLVGVARGDGAEDAAWLARRIAGLRVFPAEDSGPAGSDREGSDREGNDDEGSGRERSVAEIAGEVLAVSQFTLLANCRKGRRPSFTAAAPGPAAERLYEEFCARLREGGLPVRTGVFGAMMEVALANEGPYTLVIESPGARRSILPARGA